MQIEPNVLACWLTEVGPETPRCIDKMCFDVSDVVEYGLESTGATTNERSIVQRAHIEPLARVMGKPIRCGTVELKTYRASLATIGIRANKGRRD